MPKESPRETYSGGGNGTGWFVGIIVALALLAIGYLVFSANSEVCISDACATSVEASQ